MPNSPTHDLERLPASTIVPGPADARHYPAYNLLAWQPQGILGDQLLDDLGEWICHIEKASAPFNRFVDLSRLTEVALRTRHVFEFARKRAEQFGGMPRVNSELFSDERIGFGITQLYEELIPDVDALLAKAS